MNPVLFTGVAQPEGPAFNVRGQLLLVEMDESRRCVTCVKDGQRHQISRPGGRPTGLAIDGDDHIWVAGGPRNSLVKLSPEGEERLCLFGDDTGPFLFPNDLAFGPDGLLYMTDSGMVPEDFITGLSIRPDFFTAPYAGAVFQIDPKKGRVLRRLDTGMRFANGIAFGPDGALYATESLSGWIYRYDLDGTARREPFSQTLARADSTRFNGPDGMAFSTDGHLYCAIYGCGEVTVSAPDGRIARRLPTNGSKPTNVAFVPGRSEIVVTEVEHGAIERIDVQVGGLALQRPSLGAKGG